MPSVSVSNAEHYVWGAGCDGWRLLQGEDLSVIQERVPAGGAEVMRYHAQARQFFYVLDGDGWMVFADHEVNITKGAGLEIPPGIPHQFCNRSAAEVHFLVISAPPSHGDRVDL